MSTWVTTSVQEVFYEAFQAELTCQAELMAKSIRNTCDNGYMRYVALDLLTLQAKMRRATAEMELYTLAIENTHESDFSNESGRRLIMFSFITDAIADPPMSFYQTITQPLSGEVDSDNDDVGNDMDEDYEFW